MVLCSCEGETERVKESEKEGDDRAASSQAFGSAADLSACLCGAETPNILATSFVQCLTALVNSLEVSESVCV